MGVRMWVSQLIVSMIASSRFHIILIYRILEHLCPELSSSRDEEIT